MNPHERALRPSPRGAGTLGNRVPGRLMLRIAGAFLLACAAAFTAEPKTAYLPGDVKAVLTPEMEIKVLVPSRPGDGWEKLADRLLTHRERWRDLRKANGDREQILKNQKVIVPFELLRADFKAAVLMGFFPKDGYYTDGWHHVMGGESLWYAAQWFTGSGKNYRAIRDRNELSSLEVAAGQTIIIPRDLLWKDMRQKIRPEKLPGPIAQAETVTDRPSKEVAGPPAPAPSTGAGPGREPLMTENPPVPPVPPSYSEGGTAPPSPAPKPGEDLPSRLSFQQLLVREGAGLQLQFEGDEAVYRLKKGEALYSAVVIRFTGVEEVAEVLRIADEIARRSGITDVTRIPAGYPLKIPKDLLLPQFLPGTSLERRVWEEQERQVENVKVEVFAPRLEGVHVILDAGHGGKDSGAIAAGLWESTYVYDIYARVRNLLEETTKAAVTPLVLDQKSQFTITPADRLPQHRRQLILTTPPQALGDPQTGVNLRWKLANQKMADLGHDGVDARNVIFLSIHADALHPSIRGTMVYIPGARYSKALAGADAVNAEGYSKGLAEELVDTLYKNGLTIHPYQAVRNRIIRYRSYWLPAVLKMNYVPTKVLIEVANLNNPDDRAALGTQAFRKRFAESVVEAITSYYNRRSGKAGGTESALKKANAAPPPPAG